MNSQTRHKSWRCIFQILEKGYIPQSPNSSPPEDCDLDSNLSSFQTIVLIIIIAIIAVGIFVIQKYK